MQRVEKCIGQSLFFSLQASTTPSPYNVRRTYQLNAFAPYIVHAERDRPVDSDMVI